ncbi:MAG: hypothetical protein P8166_02975 [Candidatus Thiodiazotropha sp.]
MNHSIDKGPTLLILLLVAFAISGVGVALDGKGVPAASDTQTLIDDTIAQSVPSPRKAEVESPVEPSEVTRQPKRAIEAANGRDADSFAGLEANLVTSKTKTEEITGH